MPEGTANRKFVTAIRWIDLLFAGGLTALSSKHALGKVFNIDSSHPGYGALLPVWK
jgi:hypothetical protein